MMYNNLHMYTHFLPPLQRAVLIGINYTGQGGQLTGCHNDVHNINKYLTEVQGFRKENVTILMDDGRHKPPTKAAIMNAFKRVVKESKDGDVVFCHYSGHGGRLRDDNGDEEEEMTKEEKNQAYLDSINDGDDGYGKSTSGRNAWKQKHGKGKFNRKVQQDKHDQLHKW